MPRGGIRTLLRPGATRRGGADRGPEGVAARRLGRLRRSNRVANGAAPAVRAACADPCRGSRTIRPCRTSRPAGCVVARHQSLQPARQRSEHRAHHGFRERLPRCVENAAPGSSTFPSSVEVDAAAAPASHASTRRLQRRRSLRRRSAPASTARISGHLARPADPASRRRSSPRRRCGEGVLLPLGDPRREQSTRCTGPYEKLESAEPTFRAGLLFQFRIDAAAGFTPCACWAGGRKPLHSYSPVPRSAAPGRYRGTNRQPAAREERDVADRRRRTS